MNTGKSPGYARFPAEYYKEHIDILGPVLAEVTFEKGHTAAVSLDAEKSLGKVEWGSLFSALSHFGFGPCFSQWVQIL